VSFRASGARSPLFCACAGGGDAFDYRDLAVALPEDQPIYVFGLPELETGQQFPTVEQLAEIYVRKVRELQERGPYRLCGHSFGGLVVYEMASLLIDEGEEIDLLALLDTLNPAYSHSLSTKEQTEFRFTYFADRLAKYGRNLLSGRIDEITSDACSFLYVRGRRLGWRIARLVFERLGCPIPSVIRSDALVLSAAWRSYTPRKYNERLVLFNARDRPPEYGIDRTLGWKTCAAGAIEIHVVPGDHDTMMHPPHVRALADRLTSYLAAVRYESSP